MAVRFPHAMLFNLGEAPKSNGDGAPGTRMGTAALLRQALSESVAYQERRRKAEEKGENFDRNIKQEHLVQVLEGKVPAMFSAHRTDDLLTAIRISEEFRLKPILSLATEAYLIRDSLAEKKIPVIVHPTMQRLSNLETQHATFRNAALLNDAGIQFSLGSGFESYVPKARIVRHEAALAMAYGLPRKQALQAVTLDAAAILGVQEQYGSLVAGKVADLVIYNGDPFEHSTHVLAVISQGRLVYQRGERPSIPLADRAMLLTPEVPCCLW